MTDVYFKGPTDYSTTEFKMPEKKIEKKAKDIARANGWMVRKWSSPGTNGVADDIFIKDGRVVVIEGKRVFNKGEYCVPTGLQYDELKLWRQHGGEAYWTNSVRGYKQILGIAT